LQIGAGISFSLTLLFFVGWMFISQQTSVSTSDSKGLDSLKVVEVDFLPPPPDIDKPPPEAAEIPKEIKTVKFLPPEVKVDHQVQDEIPDQETLSENVISDENREGESGNFTVPPATTQAPTQPETPVEVKPEEPEIVAPPEPIIAPRMVRIVAPEYPPAARAAKVQAIVKVEVDIDVNGRAANPRIMSRTLIKDGRETPVATIGFGVEEAAIAAAIRHQFRPARQGTKPLEAQVVIDLKFGVE
jgi:hypothetical protein